MAADLLAGAGGLLWAFDFRRKLDENGQVIPVLDMDYRNLLIAEPNKFAFEMVPRSEKRTELMQSDGVIAESC